MRVVVWFSCGASSAIAAKLALEQFSGAAVVVVYCDTMATEHLDNQRFFDDVQRWLGVEIVKIKSEKYASVDEVMEKRRYMAGVHGAICTTEMKKVPRFRFQLPDDVHVFGYTADEPERIADFVVNNPELTTAWVLRDAGFSKARCLYELSRHGVAAPAMYGLGFEHNNCLGCVKATSPHFWQRTRRLSPEVFARRARLSREIGARLVRINGERRFLDELPPDDLPLWAAIERVNEDLSCGPHCSEGGS